MRVKLPAIPDLEVLNGHCIKPIGNRNGYTIYDTDNAISPSPDLS